MIRRLRSSTLGFLRAFGRNDRGVSALEFALIAPVLIFFYTGMAELSQAMMAQRRATHAASTLGDLIAQDSTTTTADLDKILEASTVVMMPFSSTSLKVRLTGVSADDKGKTTVDWSRGLYGLTGFAKGSTIAVPTGLVAANEHLVMAEAQYTYTSPVASVLPKPLTFNEKFYLRPRKTGEIVCSDCR